MSETTQAKARLNEIQKEANALQKEATSSFEQLMAMAERAVEIAKLARQSRIRLETLNAEALYLSLSEGLEWNEVDTPESPPENLDRIWKSLRAELLPVTAQGDWLEKIRNLEKDRSEKPFLTPEEREALELRLKENVCPICVSFSLDGSCTLEAFETCPITHYLNRMVAIVEELGHRPWMEDYFERMYRDVCPGCSGRVDKNYCPPREDGECSLFTYLPSVIRTIEEFMKERDQAQSSSM